MGKAFLSKIKVLYEDNHLLALFKPAGVPTQGDITGDVSLLEWARGWVGRKYSKPGAVFIGLVHRIDRPVSGVVLLARTSKAAARLSEQFRSHSVRKIYWAVVHGRPPSQGRISIRLSKRGSKSFPVPKEDPSGKDSLLRYRLLSSQKDYSLLELSPETGRHHQIRAILAHMGHPILGDVKYGSQERLRPGEIALLARSLTCRHPTRNLTITFESPLPEGWPLP